MNTSEIQQLAKEKAAEPTVNISAIDQLMINVRALMQEAVNARADADFLRRVLKLVAVSHGGELRRASGIG